MNILLVLNLQDSEKIRNRTAKETANSLDCIELEKRYIVVANIANGRRSDVQLSGELGLCQVTLLEEQLEVICNHCGTSVSIILFGS